MFVESVFNIPGMGSLFVKAIQSRDIPVVQACVLVTALCHLLSKPGDNLWDYESPEGRSIKKALGFITPYVLDKKNRPYPPDVMHFDAFPASLCCGCEIGKCSRAPFAW